MLRREVKRRFSGPTGGKPAAEIRQRCLSAAAGFSGFCFGGTFFQHEHFSPPSGNQSRRRRSGCRFLSSTAGQNPSGVFRCGSGQLKSQHSRIVALRGTQTLKDSKPVLLLSRVTVSLLRPPAFRCVFYSLQVKQVRRRECDPDECRTSGR